MAASLVATGAVATGTTSVTCNPFQATTQSHLLVAYVVTNSLVTATTGPAGWTLAKKVAATTLVDAEIWYKPNCAGSESNPIFSNTSATIMQAFIAEFQGVATTAVPVDQTGAASNSATPVAVSCSANDTTAADLVVVCSGWGQATATTGTFSHSAGWIDINNNGSTSLTTHIDGAYRVNTTGGTSVDADTVGFTGTNVAAVIVSFVPGISLVKAGTITAVSAATVTPAFGQATAAGNLLVARVGAQSGATSTNVGAITTSTSGWVVAVNGTSANNEPNQAAIAYKPNCGAGETAPTFTCTSATTMSADLVEIVGAAQTSPLDAILNDTVTPQNDTNNSDIAVVATAWSNSKSATYTFSDTWTPTSGAIVAAQGTGATKAATSFWGSAYLLNGHGGSTNDKDVIGNTPSTGFNSTGSPSTALASFLPASFPVASNPIPRLPVVVSFAAASASSF